MHLSTAAGSHTDGEEVEFCSYCGRLDADNERVCSECGLGVRLRTGKDVPVGPDAAFLIVREDGRVSAASVVAERLLGRHVVGKQFAAVDLGGLEATRSACGDPPATLVVLHAA